MRTLDNHELNNVSGGCFAPLSNLFGGLFGGSNASAATLAAKTNAIPAAASQAQRAVSSGLLNLGQEVEQGVSGFLRNPLGSTLSLINTGVQDAVGLFSRLI